MPSKNPGAHQPSQPKQPRKYNRKAVLAIIIIAIPSTILLAPALYYASFTLHTATITFTETTTTTTVTAAKSSPIQVDTRNVYDYAYNIQTGGILRTNDTLTSTHQATTSITIKITITTPGAQIVNLGPFTLQGGIGQRLHTLYLGPGEGVRDPGLYTLTITITATITQSTGSVQTVTTSIPPQQLIFSVQSF